MHPFPTWMLLHQVLHLVQMMLTYPMEEEVSRFQILIMFVIEDYQSLNSQNIADFVWANVMIFYPNISGY
jgi:hypothetical protein